MTPIETLDTTDETKNDSVVEDAYNKQESVNAKSTIEVSAVDHEINDHSSVSQNFIEKEIYVAPIQEDTKAVIISDSKSQDDEEN